LLMLLFSDRTQSHHPSPITHHPLPWRHSIKNNGSYQISPK
jgi:hypothetical protein